MIEKNPSTFVCSRVCHSKPFISFLVLQIFFFVVIIEFDFDEVILSFTAMNVEIVEQIFCDFFKYFLNITAVHLFQWFL